MFTRRKPGARPSASSGECVACLRSGQRAHETRMKRAWRYVMSRLRRNVAAVDSSLACAAVCRGEAANEPAAGGYESSRFTKARKKEDVLPSVSRVVSWKWQDETKAIWNVSPVKSSPFFLFGQSRRSNRYNSVTAWSWKLDPFTDVSPLCAEESS